MTEEGLQGAGISPRERLERIENILERIDTKLDNKADKEMVVGLEARLSRMELEGSRQSQVTETNLNTFRHDTVSDMEKLRVRIYSLETDDSTGKAIGRYRTALFASVVAAVSAVTAVVWLVASIR